MTATRAVAAPLFYRAADFVMVRTPLLPIDAYPTAEELAATPATTRIRESADARRAIAVSSLSLATALLRPAGTARDRQRLESGALRYLIRLTTRPTPFGLAAGVALGTWGTSTDVRLTGESPRIRARPDMRALHDLVIALEARPEIRAATRVVANPAAHIRAGRITLGGITARQTTAGGENVSLRATGAVIRALTLARTAVGYGELSSALLATVAGASAEKVDGLLHSLWLHEFLLTDLRPPLTGSDPAGHVVDALGHIPAAASARAELTEMLTAVGHWAREPAEAGADSYPALARRVARVTGSDTATPLQVDMALPLASARVSRTVAAEAVRAAELLLRLTPFPDGPPSIAAYRRAFVARYGPDRDVRLLELLDPVTGLGQPDQATPPATDASRTDALLRLATDALHEHRAGIELDAPTVDRLAVWTPEPSRLPPSLDLYVQLAAPSTAAIDAGDFRLVVGANVGAGAAGRNLGRFAGLLPGALTALTGLADAEQDLLPGRILAELVYLPEKTRAANVIVRPSVRDYDVGLRTSAHEGPARHLPLDELLVRVTAGRFALVWDDGTGTAREVIVCTGHMLNHSRAPAVCRLLAELGRDRVAQLSGFDWGPARAFPYLPRVTSGRVVLRLAQWRIDDVAGQQLIARPDGFPAAFQAWRDRWRVPRLVYLAHSGDAADHRLLLDLAAPAHLEEIRRACAGGGAVVLQEALPGPDDAWGGGPGGRYAVELVVSMTRRAVSPDTGTLRPVSRRVPAAVRLRPPGSDWTFVKLYGQPEDQDGLIAGGIRELIDRLSGHSAPDRWMFLRYADPEPHLRLRVHGDAGRLIPAVSEWATALLAEGHLTRFSFDIYDREVERYGGEAAMTITEQLYTADSRAVADLLALHHTRQTDLDRIAVALLNVDDLLAGLGLGTDDRLEFYRRHAPERLAGAEYRTRKQELYDLLRKPATGPVGDILADRRARLQAVTDQLAQLARDGKLGKPAAELYGSYVHLSGNRLLGTDRAAEHRVVELLGRTRRGLACGG